MIEIPKVAVRAIEAHGREAFPEECCGFLIGSSEEPRRVAGARRARNAAEGDRSSRYRVDPLELLHADEAARSESLDLLGIYHSHPNYPSTPSEYDRSHAASWYSYVIQGLDARGLGKLTSWRFDEARKQFGEEPVRIL